jgi:proteasome beta subunit
MATIVGIEVDGGAAIAGDRQLTQGGTVQSGSKRHVFDLGEVGAAAVGDSGGVDEFRRRLEAEIRDYETQHGDPMEMTRLANVASDIAEDEGVEAIVAGRDDREVARIRGVDSSGGVTTDAVIAKGSGAQFTLGVLEGVERGISLDSAEDLLRDALDTAADRDTATGEDVDTFSLDSDGGRLTD